MSRTKRYTVGLLLLLAAAPIALAKEQSLLARVTVYWASGGSGSDSWSRNHIAASGAHLRAGHCAVDPRRIPYGSRVILPDAALVAVDTGSAVRSRRAARLAGRSTLERNAIVIDRFFETKGQAMAWANRNPQFMTVQVEAPNESLNTVQAVRTRASTTSKTMLVANNSRSSMVKAPAPNLLASNPPRSATTGTAPPLNDPSQKLVAQNTEQPRSHYGRAVAYLP
ncbi:MAG: hypothetical protein ACXWFY_01015 [Chthoniobacterales bacterium]